jgi:hypothetical protein
MNREEMHRQRGWTASTKTATEKEAARDWVAWVEGPEGYLMRFFGPTSMSAAARMAKKAAEDLRAAQQTRVGYEPVWANIRYAKDRLRNKSPVVFSKLPRKDRNALDAMLAQSKTATEKEAAYGLYGFPNRTASLGLRACSELRQHVGSVAYDLHQRRVAMYEQITGFLRQHSKQSRCHYSRILLSSYPDAPPRPKEASEKEAAPASVDSWLSWE